MTQIFLACHSDEAAADSAEKTRCGDRTAETLSSLMNAIFSSREPPRMAAQRPFPLVFRSIGLCISRQVPLRSSQFHERQPRSPTRSATQGAGAVRHNGTAPASQATIMFILVQSNSSGEAAEPRPDTLANPSGSPPPSPTPHTPRSKSDDKRPGSLILARSVAGPKTTSNRELTR